MAWLFRFDQLDKGHTHRDPCGHALTFERVRVSVAIHAIINYMTETSLKGEARLKSCHLPADRFAVRRLGRAATLLLTKPDIRFEEISYNNVTRKNFQSQRVAWS